MAEEEIKTIVDAAPEGTKPDEPEQAAASPAKKRRKVRRSVPSGQMHVQATFNNTIVTITDPKGNVLASSSAGASGFRGSKKGTAYAAQVAAEKAVTSAKQSFGLSKVEVLVKGIGLGRDAAVRTLINQGVAIESLRDVTGTPHGGVRPRKPRRS